MTNELPRLSRFLRQNTQLELPRQLSDNKDCRRVVESSNLWPNHQTWKDLKQFLQSKCPENYQQLNAKLEILWSTTREFIGT